MSRSNSNFIMLISLQVDVSTFDVLNFDYFARQNLRPGSNIKGQVAQILELEDYR